MELPLKAGREVNPFWSDRVQRSVQGQGGRHAAAGGNHGGQNFDTEIEKLKEKCLRDAEEAFARERGVEWAR